MVGKRVTVCSRNAHGRTGVDKAMTGSLCVIMVCLLCSMLRICSQGRARWERLIMGDPVQIGLFPLHSPETTSTSLGHVPCPQREW